MDSSNFTCNGTTDADPGSKLGYTIGEVTKGVTNNVIATLSQNQAQFNTLYCPVLQILKLVSVNTSQGTDAERYYVIFSDGTHLARGILAPQLNHHIHDKEVTDLSLIRITNYVTAVNKDYTFTIILRFDTVKPHPGHNSDNPVGNSNMHTQSNAPVALPSIYSSKIFEPTPNLPTATRIDSKAIYQDVLGVDDNSYISPTSNSPPTFFTQGEDGGTPEVTTTINEK